MTELHQASCEDTPRAANLVKMTKLCLLLFKNGPSTAPFASFSFFSNNLQSKNCRLSEIRTRLMEHRLSTLTT